MQLLMEIFFQSQKEKLLINFDQVDKNILLEWDKLYLDQRNHFKSAILF